MEHDTNTRMKTNNTNDTNRGFVWAHSCCRSPFRAKARYSCAGFSLVETIIYIGLLILIIVAVVNMLIGMSKAYGFMRLSTQIQTSAIDSLDRVVREIRNAKSVDTAGSTLGTSPGVLTLNSTDDTGSAVTYQFLVSGGVLRIKQNGVDQGPLTLPNVTVSNLVFQRMATGVSQAVKIEMTLVAGSGSMTRTAKFYGTAILRDSY